MLKYTSFEERVLSIFLKNIYDLKKALVEKCWEKIYYLFIYHLDLIFWGEIVKGNSFGFYSKYKVNMVADERYIKMDHILDIG